MKIRFRQNKNGNCTFTGNKAVQIFPLLPVLLLTLALVLTGCGASASDKISELQTYQDQMETFFDDIDNYTRQLSSLDPASEQTAASASSAASITPDSAGDSESLPAGLSETEAQFLTLIDKLAGSCRTAARVHVPEDYSPAGSLCQKANDAMQEAKENYHSAFESASFNETDFNTAQNDYRSAMETIQALTQYFQSYGEGSAESSAGASS